jgi:hypothetical protein
MKRTTAFTVLALGPVALACLLCVCSLFGSRWIFSEHMEIDINSGDTRCQVRLCSLKVVDRIDESLLSREAHRLGIDMPATREWKSGGTRFFGGEGYSPYGLILGAGDHLVERLNETNTPDQERRVILEKFMRVMRTQVPHEIDRELSRLLAE